MPETLPKTFDRFEAQIRERALQGCDPNDPSHDALHLDRVVTSARKLCHEEGADEQIVVPAAWLHDCVAVPKSDPRRSQASRLSAQAATEFLGQIGYPEAKLKAIAHAIEAHSFSAKIEPRTLEAKIVQDADRLDGLGAIGIARLFATAVLMKASFYDGRDPSARDRALDDRKFALDHIPVKLFKVAETLQTAAGRREGSRRAGFLRQFVDQFNQEIASS